MYVAYKDIKNIPVGYNLLKNIINKLLTSPCTMPTTTFNYRA